MNVLIVDDQKSSRELMKYAISESDNYVLVGEIDNANDVLNFCQKNKVDLILMDIYTGNKENGIKNAKKVKLENPNIKIIIVTFLVQEEHLKMAREIGCEGFWYKDHSEFTLVDVMNKVSSGTVVYPDEMPQITIGFANASDFTKQELNVLRHKVNGYSHTEICESLNITRSTLNYHISNLKRKTGYNNTLKLAVDVLMKKFMIADDLPINSNDNSPKE